MQTCAIYISHYLNDFKYQMQLEELVSYAKDNNLKLQNTITNFEEFNQFLTDENRSNLLIIYSLKVFGKSSSNCVESLNRIFKNPNLNLFVYQNKMYAKDTNGILNYNFKIILEVLGLVSKMEQQKSICR